MAPEATAGITLDIANGHMTPADAGVLTRLADQWKQIATDLQNGISQFYGIYSGILESPSWQGSAASAMRSSLDTFSQNVSQLSERAMTNSSIIRQWSTQVGSTKQTIEALATSRTATATTTAPEDMVAMKNSYDLLARMEIDGSYNPGVTAISAGLTNLIDPASPVVGAPLLLPGMPKYQPPSSGVSTPAVFAGGGSAGGGGAAGGGGGGGGGGSRAGSDAAAALARRASGDPAAAARSAAESAKTPPAAGPSPAGSGNPAASAAQQAASKAGSSMQGLASKGLGDPAGTRSSGLSSMNAAERAAAAEKAAMAKAGGGAGGGGAGGGGAGKLGGIGGAAAGEASLSARGASSMSAAERALAAEQGAMANSRAGAPGTAATPMGARPGGTSEDGKNHKSARYLRSTANADEAIGEIDETAPPVLGGLNLDTTDDTTDKRPPRR